MLNRAKILPVALVAVVTVSALGASNPCETASPTADRWTESDVRVFSIRLPPGFNRRDVEGVDSFIGQWVRGGDTISCSFGPRYSPVPEGDCLEEIDGVNVAMAFRESPSGRFKLTAHWRPEDENDLFLGILVDVASSESRMEALAAVRSVVLKNILDEE